MEQQKKIEQFVAEIIFYVTIKYLLYLGFSRKKSNEIYQRAKTSPKQAFELARKKVKSKEVYRIINIFQNIHSLHQSNPNILI